MRILQTAEKQRQLLWPLVDALLVFRSHSAVDLGGDWRKHSHEEGLLDRSSADLECKRPKQNLILMLNAFEVQTQKF